MITEDVVQSETADSDSDFKEYITPRPILISLDQVVYKPLEWLWPNRIPMGKLTLIVGDPGEGKSYLTILIAKHVTRGLPWVDSADAPPQGSVVLLSAEDGVADTIKARVDLIGADASKIKILKGVESPRDGRRFVDLSNDLPAIERAAKDLGDVKALIIDPISAYMGRVNTLHNSAVRACLGPLADLAEKYGIAIIGVSHLNKKQDLKAVYRTTDSLAFVATARAVWLVGSDPADPEKARKFFLPVKFNLGPRPKGLAFRLYDDKGPVFEEGEIDFSPDDMSSSNQYETTSALDEAISWLKDALSKGPVAATDITRAAREVGIKERTLLRAKKAIGALSLKHGAEGETRWTWQLPSVRSVTSASAESIN